jgi:hypothetical protein
MGLLYWKKLVFLREICLHSATSVVSRNAGQQLFFVSVFLRMALSLLDKQ